MPTEHRLSATPRRMKLGLSVGNVGSQDASWGDPAIPSAQAMSLAHHIKAAEIAERGRIDFLLLTDMTPQTDQSGPGSAQARLKLDPIMAVAALAAVTSRVGLVATASTATLHPYNFARRMASIDHISGGRLGWNLVTGVSSEEAPNFTLDAAPSLTAQQARAGEFVSVLHDLFDTWDDDAFLRDKASGIYLDRAKFHFLNHEGEHFKIRGPLDVARPPQGRIPIAVAGVSDHAMEQAARFADITYAWPSDIAAARDYAATVRKLHRNGRSPDAMLMMPGIQCHLGESRSEAEDKFARTSDLLDRKASGLAGAALIGTPAMVADAMEEWFVTGAADGFVVQPTGTPQDAEDFVTLVIPELQRRGLFRTAYEGRTLRANLGLSTVPDRAARQLAQFG